MRKLLLLLAFGLSFQAFGDAPLVIQARDCKFFSALTAGTDRNSTDVGAFGRPFDISKMGRMSVQVTWASLTSAGSIDAVVKVQVSSVASPASSDWIDKSGATFTITSAGGTNLINVTSLGESWARVVYTKNSVTAGTLDGFCHAKSF